MTCAGLLASIQHRFSPILVLLVNTLDFASFAHTTNPEEKVIAIFA